MKITLKGIYLLSMRILRFNLPCLFISFFTLLTVQLYASPLNAPLGYSGMAKIDSHTYIVVHDKKVYEDGNRLGILRIQQDNNPEYIPIKVDDWKHDDGQSNDLESICVIPDHPSDFLAAESGYWKGQYGRIFHLKLNAELAEVVSVYHLPLILDNNENQEGDNFEGMTCVKHNNQILLIIGERGGSNAYEHGILRLGVLDYDNTKLSWKKYEKGAISVTAPGSWISPNLKRDISDLYADEKGILWAAATEDAGDKGPFRSIIYKVATIGKGTRDPITIMPVSKAAWVIDGFKVEALAGPTDIVPGSFMSFATEDESLNGNWRPLYPPVD